MIYEIGHIYMIWDIEDHNLVYYGSTKKDMKTRMMHHNKPSNDCASKQIIDRKNYEYVVLETHENIDKYDLVEREKWYIENKPCVNKHIPHQTKKEYDQKYYHMNKEKIAKYYQNNKEKMAEYRQNNKEKIAEYYQNNKEKIAEYQKTNEAKLKKRFVCKCGGKSTFGGKSHHEKTKRHKKWIQSLIT